MSNNVDSGQATYYPASAYGSVGTIVGPGVGSRTPGIHGFDTIQGMAYVISSTGTPIYFAGGSINPGNGTAALSAISNPNLAALSTKTQSDSYQFANGSRWFWSATGTPNGGTVVAGSVGFWNRELEAGSSINAAWFGINGDGTDESALILSVLQSAVGKNWKLLFPATPQFYNVGANGISLLVTGDNYAIECEPNTAFKASNNTAPCIFSFSGVGANFNFSGGIFSWLTMPTVRGGAAALYVNGVSMTNVMIKDVRILNSVNFGVFCRGMANGGSNTLSYNNIFAGNTLGDGVHVENFDHSISISNIETHDNGDDAVAITQYTGTTGAPTKSNPVYNVTINNVTSYNPTLAVVKLEGVSQATVSNITATGGASSSNSVLLQCVSGNDYSQHNSNVILSNCTADGLRQIFAVATVGAGNYHSRYTLSKITGTNISGDAIIVIGLNAGNADLSEIWIDGIQLTSSVGGTGKPLFVTQAVGVHIRNFKCYGFADSFTVANNIDVELDNIEFWNPSATINGIVLVASTRVRYSKLIVIDNQAVKKLAVGLQIQLNSNIRGLGGCEVSGQTGLAVLGGSNTNATGFIDELSDIQGVGTLAAGAVTVVVFSRPILATKGPHVQVTAMSDAASPVSARNAGLTQVEVLNTAALTNAAIHYTVRGLLN